MQTNSATLLAQAARCYQQGQIDQTVAICLQVLEADPQAVPALDMLGVLELRRGNAAEGVQYLEAALHASPQRAPQWSNLGVGLQMLGRYADSVVAFDQAIRIDAHYARAYSNRAESLLQLGQPQEALACCDRAVALEPTLAEAHGNRANALRELRRFEDALSAVNTAITLCTPSALLYNNRGNVLRDLHRYDEALEDFDRVVELSPNYCEAFVNYGNVYKDLGRLDDAMAQYRRALDIDPGHPSALWHMALIELLRGNDAEGWRLYEWRWHCLPLLRVARSFAQPEWDGQPAPDKTLLVYAEQGFGDTVQFCRYLPRARARVGRLIVEVPPTLLPLVSTLADDIAFVAAGAPLPDFDLQCAMLSLPHRLGIPEIAAPAPYLQIDPAKRALWRQRLGEKTKPRIGLCWSGSFQHKNDARRSLSLSRLLPLQALPCAFYAVQKDVQPEDLSALVQMNWIAFHGEALADFSDTAALLGEMDLTISVDTAVAHVAGALGRPVWTLLPKLPDWRWRLERPDTPWYGQMRLYRQSTQDDWTAPLAAVLADLTALVAR